MLRQQEERDHRDSTRSDSPLTVADDAAILDTSALSVDQVVDAVIAMLGSLQGRSRGALDSTSKTP